MILVCVFSHFWNPLPVSLPVVPKSGEQVFFLCVFRQQAVQKYLSRMGNRAGYKTRKHTDCWHGKWEGWGWHAKNAKKTDICRDVGRGTNSGRVMVGKFEQSSLQGSAPTFFVRWCSFSFECIELFLILHSLNLFCYTCFAHIVRFLLSRYGSQINKFWHFL